MPNKKLKVLMVTAEMAPFAKVGGLADVAGSLPPAIQKLNCDVRMVMPLYGSIDRTKFKIKEIYSGLEVPSGRLMIKVNICFAQLPGTDVKVYFIDSPDYFSKEDVYAPGDNSERFLFFSLASLYMIPVLNFYPDLVHCHDSHTALIPDIIKTSNLDFIRELKTLYTIHNFRYQGKTRVNVLSTGNLHSDSLKSLQTDTSDGDLNFMVQGVMNADIVNTVSPTYAKEICTSAYGAKLEKIIRKRKKDLFGVVNGIDTEFFNPVNDKHIYKNFSEKSLNLKLINKVKLQKEVGLPVDEQKPLVGIVTRLVWQKGLEFLTDKFAGLDCQFLILGTGHKEIEDQFKDLAKRFPRKFSANIKFNIDLAQKIYAGSDMFLMPSRFEPCGLGQLIAMRYGTVPVVRETGGLADTVVPLEIKKLKTKTSFPNKKKALGFSFKNLNTKDFYKSLEEAIEIYYHHPLIWKQIMQNGMTADFSWDRSAKEYLKLYKKAIKK